MTQHKTQQPSDTRLTQLKEWLQPKTPALGIALETLEPASSDASFRRYFRIQAHDRTLVVMDAPPTQENCEPFLHVTALLRDVGLNVPTILAQDLQQGFLLISDLGPQTYYQAIQSGLSDDILQARYREALSALATMQTAKMHGLPVYDESRMLAELSLFPEWYVERHCNATLTQQEREDLDTLFQTLETDNVRGAKVLVHRDFHSPNLMLCSEPRFGANPGIIDYQDAVAGPITYDIASLVMDARASWEEPQQLDWAIRYWQEALKLKLPVDTDFTDFHRAYEWMGLQRNLRILGVFARLSLRDGKHHYLDHIPRVMTYVRQVAERYIQFKPLLRLLDRLEGKTRVMGLTL
ncbi:MAG TPA: aminoglycoside phosphotransferase [Pusillimonas sp.]|nr:aminoglycoside phosphotransferase [Pusillimonas sp.]